MIRVQMFGGPQDGLVISVPPDCLELRFPVPMSLTVKPQTHEIEAAALRVSLYRRSGTDFYYEGEQ